MQTDVLIVGAGLAGLALARHLEAAGRDWHIVEARDRVGGRILTRSVAGVPVDLGPAWIWPGQMRIDRLLRDVGLTTFPQYADGRLVYQDGSGAVRRDIDMAPMAGSLRIAGGIGGLTERLADTLANDRIHLGWRLHALEAGDTTMSAFSSDGDEIIANHVIITAPPRLASQTITFAPTLPDGAITALRAVPTWMAGHAKALIIYQTPFWRAAGLSGDAISHTGPLTEIHDASPADDNGGALFGFFGLPAHERARHLDLAGAVASQLTALFGTEAANPLAIEICDWARDPLTATTADHTAPSGHPAYGTPPALTGLWDGRLIFASSEMAPEFGGFLEGALEAAERTARLLENTPAGPQNWT